MGHKHETQSVMPFTTKELSTRTWPDFAKLFEEHGGVWGGCWCMFYHVTEGWGKRKPRQNRVEKQELVRLGKAHGILVYCSGAPVGWCQFGPGEELPRVDRKRDYTRSSEDAWRITCFFVDGEHRRMGVAREALKAALRAMQRRGAKQVEAYPVLKGEGKTSSSFLWSGTSELFETAGFSRISRLGTSSAVYRKDLRTRA